MGTPPSSPAQPFLGTATPLTGEYFVGGNSVVNRAAAAIVCEQQDAVLASVHTDVEWYQIRTTCSNFCGSTAGCGCWMGFKDDGTEGIWLNDDHTYQDYLFYQNGAPDLNQPAPWHAGEPNNAGSGGEDCVHTWASQFFDLNDIACTSSDYYPMCRKIDFNGQSQARKCQPGYDNDEYGECSIPMACWGSDSHLVGDQTTTYNDVPGCGMTSCEDRYDKENVAACNEWCRTTTGCVAYSWTAYGGDQNVPGVKTCTMYDASQATPNQAWGTNQIFCEVCGLAAAHQGLPEQDLLTFVHQHNDIKDSTWTELLAINAAVSAAVSVFVMALFMTVWCLCVRSKKRGTYSQVEKLGIDVDDEEEQIISA